VQQFTLETRDSTGATAWRTVQEAEDLNAVLWWAVRNWHPAQGTRHPAGGYYLNPGLFIDGVPLAQAVNEFERSQRGAA